MNACDIFVLPSVGAEDFPNVLLLAMMYGKPIITTNVGGISEVVSIDKDSPTGILLEPDPYLLDYLLWNKIRLLDANGNLAKRMGINGKKKYGLEYNNERIMKTYINLWES
jgi:glycosyltransferase involved in cell wall biosynthesis